MRIQNFITFFSQQTENAPTSIARNAPRKSCSMFSKLDFFIENSCLFSQNIRSDFRETFGKTKSRTNEDFVLQISCSALTLKNL
jgi:hypothetical protein